MDDKIIVDSIFRNGRTQLFSLIVKKYGSTVYAKALAITKDAEEAKEIAQQTFVKAYQQLEDWQGTQLGPWLVAIACHLSLSTLSKRKSENTMWMPSKCRFPTNPTPKNGRNACNAWRKPSANSLSKTSKSSASIIIIR